MILQLLQLAVVLPPGTLAVSIYESGSSDLTRYWLNLLHLLLLPLKTPHHLVTDGLLKPQVGLDRITLMAALRNAALQPFFNFSAPGRASSGNIEVIDNGSAQEHRKGRQGSSRRGSVQSRVASRRSGMLVLSGHLRPDFRPAYVVFANDVFFCAGDVLRLASHEADVTCGMDFYSAPWDTAPADSRSRSSSRDAGGEVQANAEGHGASGRLRSSIGRGILWHRLGIRHLWNLIREPPQQSKQGWQDGIWLGLGDLLKGMLRRTGASRGREAVANVAGEMVQRKPAAAREVLGRGAKQGRHVLSSSGLPLRFYDKVGDAGLKEWVEPVALPLMAITFRVSLYNGDATIKPLQCLACIICLVAAPIHCKGHCQVVDCAEAWSLGLLIILIAQSG
jgi:hypothetical protein